MNGLPTDDSGHRTASRAIVVGGYGAIGKEVSKGLASNGAKVAVAGRSKEHSVALAQELSVEGATSLGQHVDVTELESVQDLVDTVRDAWGGVDILVNCASALTVCPAEDFTETEWRYIVDTNLFGAFWLSQAAGRTMIESGEGGRIVHLSSVRGSAGASRGFTAYGASKAGLNLLIKQLATEWGRHGITVNAVSPGFVRTAFVEEAAQDSKFLSMITARTPLGRTAEVQEVADAVLFLTSQKARFITGQNIFVDGGVSVSQ